MSIGKSSTQPAAGTSAPAPAGPSVSATQTSPPPGFQTAYNALGGQAMSLASQPWVGPYPGQLVSQFTPQQLQAFQQVNQLQGQFAPFINAAGQAFGQATQPIWPTLPQYNVSGLPQAGISSIANAPQYAAAAAQPIAPTVQPYAQLAQTSAASAPQNMAAFYSPFTEQVAGNLQNLFNQQNAQQLAQVAGSEVGQGAFGGDRQAVAEALTAQQQQLAQAPVMAQTLQQGFQAAQQQAAQQAALETQAATQGGQLMAGALGQQGQLGLGAGQLNLAAGQGLMQDFAQQQQAQMAAEQANAWLASQAGFGMGQLGQEQQALGLQGLGALEQAGLLQQQLGQYQLNVPYSEWQQMQAWPYQQLQFAAPIVEGVGSLSGGTAATSQAAPSTLSQLAGLGLTGAGILSATGGLSGLGNLFGGGGLSGVDYSAGTASFLPGTSIPFTSAVSGAGGVSGVGVNRGGRISGYQAGGGIGTGTGLGSGGLSFDPSFPGELADVPIEPTDLIPTTSGAQNQGLRGTGPPGLGGGGGGVSGGVGGTGAASNPFQTGLQALQLGTGIGNTVQGLTSGTGFLGTIGSGIGSVLSGIGSIFGLEEGGAVDGHQAGGETQQQSPQPRPGGLLPVPTIPQSLIMPMDRVGAGPGPAVRGPGPPGGGSGPPQPPRPQESGFDPLKTLEDPTKSLPLIKTLFGKGTTPGGTSTSETSPSEAAEGGSYQAGGQIDPNMGFGMTADLLRAGGGGPNPMMDSLGPSRGGLAGGSFGSRSGINGPNLGFQIPHHFRVQEGGETGSEATTEPLLGETQTSSMMTPMMQGLLAQGQNMSIEQLQEAEAAHPQYAQLYNLIRMRKQLAAPMTAGQETSAAMASGLASGLPTSNLTTNFLPLVTQGTSGQPAPVGGGSLLPMQTAAEGGDIRGPRNYVTEDELDPHPVVDHSGKTIVVHYPSEGKSLDLGLPTSFKQHAAAKYGGRIRMQAGGATPPQYGELGGGPGFAGMQAGAFTGFNQGYPGVSGAGFNAPGRAPGFQFEPSQAGWYGAGAGYMPQFNPQRSVLMNEIMQPTGNPFAGISPVQFPNVGQATAPQQMTYANLTGPQISGATYGLGANAQVQNPPAIPFSSLGVTPTNPNAWLNSVAAGVARGGRIRLQGGGDTLTEDPDQPAAFAAIPPEARGVATIPQAPQAAATIPPQARATALIPPEARGTAVIPPAFQTTLPEARATAVIPPSPRIPLIPSARVAETASATAAIPPEPRAIASIPPIYAPDLRGEAAVDPTTMYQGAKPVAGFISDYFPHIGRDIADFAAHPLAHILGTESPAQAAVPPTPTGATQHPRSILNQINPNVQMPGTSGWGGGGLSTAAARGARPARKPTPSGVHTAGLGQQPSTADELNREELGWLQAGHTGRWPVSSADELNRQQLSTINPTGMQIGRTWFGPGVDPTYGTATGLGQQPPTATGPGGWLGTGSFKPGWDRQPAGTGPARPPDTYMPMTDPATGVRYRAPGWNNPPMVTDDTTSTAPITPVQRTSLGPSVVNPSNSGAAVGGRIRLQGGGPTLTAPDASTEGVPGPPRPTGAITPFYGGYAPEQTVPEVHPDIPTAPEVPPPSPQVAQAAPSLEAPKEVKPKPAKAISPPKPIPATTESETPYTPPTVQPTPPVMPVSAPAAQTPSPGIGATPQATTGTGLADMNAAVERALARIQQHQEGGEFYGSPGMAMMAAGLGMLGGGSPWAGVNIGRGGLEGLQTYAHQQEQLPELELKRVQAAEAEAKLAAMPYQMQLSADIARRFGAFGAPLGPPGTGTAAGATGAVPPMVGTGTPLAGAGVIPTDLTKATGPDGKPLPQSALQSYPFLAQQRASYKTELDQNPTLKKQLAAIIDMENPGAGIAVAEALFNRLSYFGGSVASGVGMGNPKSFYGPVRRGSVEGRLAQLEHNPQVLAERMAQIDQALAGSNITMGYSDQGSERDPNYQKGGIGVNWYGERFNDYDAPDAARLREQQQAQLGQSITPTEVQAGRPVHVAQGPAVTATDAAMGAAPPAAIPTGATAGPQAPGVAPAGGAQPAPTTGAPPGIPPGFPVPQGYGASGNPQLQQLDNGYAFVGNQIASTMMSLPFNFDKLPELMGVVARLAGTYDHIMSLDPRMAGLKAAYEEAGRLPSQMILHTFETDQHIREAFAKTGAEIQHISVAMPGGQGTWEVATPTSSILNGTAPGMSGNPLTPQSTVPGLDQQRNGVYATPDGQWDPSGNSLVPVGGTIPGGAITKTNYSPGIQKELDNQAERLNEMAKSSGSNPIMKQNLQDLQTYLNAYHTNAITGNEFVRRAAAIASALGIDIPGIAATDAQSIQKLVTNLQFGMVKAMGGRPMVTELQQAMQGLPGLGLTHEANMRILEMLMRENNYQTQRYSYAQKVWNQYGQLGDFEAKWAANSPMGAIDKEIHSIIFDPKSREIPGWIANSRGWDDRYRTSIRPADPENLNGIWYAPLPDQPGHFIRFKPPGVQ